MKRFSKLIGFIVVFMVMMATMCTVSFAATVGQQLMHPESGWQRFDDNNKKIHYKGSWSVSTYSGFWGGTDNYSTSIGSTVSFKFYGTKLRIIGQYHNTKASPNTQISIDGANSSYSEYSAVVDNYSEVQYIVFEKSGLGLGVHTITISVKNSDTTRFDAIDIDESGYLIDYNVPTNLQATASNAKVDLSWDAVEGATSYNIKRATTAGGTYTTISENVNDTNYKDTTVTNGNK